AVSDITSVVIETYEFAVQVAADSRDKWHPANRETADHSIPYVAAVGLARGNVWLDDFDEARISEPAIVDLMQKIQVRAIDEFTRAWPEAYPFRFTITTRSGERHVAEIRYAKGHPRNALSDQEIAAKFQRLAAPVMDAARITTLLARLWELEA